MKSTEENNKLIAEFMDMEVANIDEDVWVITDIHNGLMEETNARFHVSWDWLMPVIEKIESVSIDEYTRFSVSIENYYCCIKGHAKNRQPGLIYQSIYRKDYVSKIEAVYEAVVEFMDFYNNPSDYWSKMWAKTANNDPV